MKLHIVFLLTGLSLASAHPRRRLTPDINAASFEINSLEQDESHPKLINTKRTNIEATIKQVEDLLRTDPTLPRLTRGEILDLLDNITTNEQQKLRDPKAIMVVMPYTPSNLDDKNMEDLYTKPPITQMIDEPTDDPDSGINKTKTQHRRRPSGKLSSKKTTEQPKITTIQNSNQLIDNNLNQNVENFVSTTPSQVKRRRPILTTELPEITNFDNKQQTTEIHETFTSKRRRPLRRRTTTTSTTTTFHPNPYLEITTKLPSGGLQIIDSPSLFVPQKPNSDLIIDENNKQEVVFEQAIPVGVSPNTTPKPLTISEDIGLPENFHNVVKDLNLDTAIIEHERPKISTEDHNRIKELLASIGAVTTTTTTTSTTMPDVAVVADTLSPEMKDLLMSFGLIPNPNEKPQPEINNQFNPEKAETHPDSYIGFKPLPETDSARDDMETLLASFGLGRNSRKEKSLKALSQQSEDKTNFDVVPDNFRSVLKDLGIDNFQQEDVIEGQASEQKIVEKQHVFNPDSQSASKEDLKKLDKLLDTIKQLEKLNGTATEEDLKNIDLESIKELVGSLNNDDNSPTLDQKNNSPNPIHFDLGVSKNEVKRQEDATTTTTTTTEEPKNPPLADLEASFGGEPATTSESPPETTTRIFTGFYRLVDWNTFLDIDDQKGRRVNLRFQPKVGDPKRFLSVTVP